MGGMVRAHAAAAEGPSVPAPAGRGLGMLLIPVLHARRDQLLGAGRDGLLAAWPVGREVNSPANNAAGLIEPAPEESVEEQ